MVFDGDLAAMLDDPMAPTAINVIDDKAKGFFLFSEYGWDGQNSAGVQYAMADLVEDPTMDATELDLYFTHYMTELRRLRFGVTIGEEGGVWDFETLNEFLEDPKGYVPGNKMGFGGISRMNQRADLLMYLRDQSDNPMPLPVGEAPAEEATEAASE